jgi:hypothetical protein
MARAALGERKTHVNSPVPGPAGIPSPLWSRPTVYVKLYINGVMQRW